MPGEKHSICPASKADSLDSWLRKILQNPKRMLGKYVAEGMSVLDIGCGPGHFSVEIAKMVGNSGKVAAADLQQEMLDRVKSKVSGTELEKRIRLHKTSATRIGLKEKFDFRSRILHRARNTPLVQLP